MKPNKQNQRGEQPKPLEAGELFHDLQGNPVHFSELIPDILFGLALFLFLCVTIATVLFIIPSEEATPLQFVLIVLGKLLALGGLIYLAPSIARSADYLNRCYLDL